MRIISEHVFTRLGVVATILAVTSLGPYKLHSSIPDRDESRRVLLQGKDVGAIVALVENAGGTVSHKLDVLQAVGASLSPSQLGEISRSAHIHRILDDTRVALNSVEQCISKEHYQYYINTQIGKFDGKNSERIANRILKLLQNQ